MPLGLFPEQASTFAPQVDHLLYFLLAVAVFFTVGIFTAIAYFAIRYRRRSDQELPGAVHGSVPLEIAWSVIPFGLTMVMFTWGASVYFKESRPPDNALQIYVVGKQWMWKLQHMEGRREINELHIPLGRPVKLTMTSEDVIHSFFVPAFRIKQDVVPGRYTTLWFQPTKPGRYHLFCAEYCGTRHSGMTGWIEVMSPRDYQAWLSGGPSTGSLAENGQRLFEDLACGNCHKADGSGRCPTLVNLFGSDCSTYGRRHREGRRSLHSRIDLAAGGQDRGRLPAGHADFPGAGHRRGRPATGGIHQIPGIEDGGWLGGGQAGHGEIAA